MTGERGTGGKLTAMARGIKRWRSGRIGPRPMTGIAVVLGLVGFTLAVAVSPATIGYPFVLATVTILVLATAWTVYVGSQRRAGPGRWLGRRSVRRSLVAIIAVDCLAIASGDWGTGISGTTITDFVLGLILLNVALGRATQRLATAVDSVDERQELLRNSAHRMAYWGVAVVLGAVVVVADTASPATRTWLEHSIGGGTLWVFFEYVFVLPAMVIAWREPDMVRMDDPEHRRTVPQMIVVALGALTLPAILIGSACISVLPTTTVAWHGDENVTNPWVTGPAPATTPPGAGCQYFHADTQVGAGIGADIPLNAVACWDGKTAAESWGLNDSDCMIRDTVMATVNTVECTRRTDPNGTLHFTYRAGVRPVLLPFLVREVTLSLVLDRNGHIVRFP